MASGHVSENNVFSLDVFLVFNVFEILSAVVSSAATIYQVAMRTLTDKSSWCNIETKLWAMLKTILVSKRSFAMLSSAAIIISQCILTCFNQVVRSSGSLQYKDKLIAAIKSTIHLKCKEAATLGATVSRVYSTVFANITCTCTVNTGV